MNSIEEKYTYEVGVNQNYNALSIFGLIPDKSIKKEKKVLSFIKSWLRADCWLSASITPSGEVFVLHNLFQDSSDKDKRDWLEKDIPLLLNLGRKIILICFSGGKYFSFQKRNDEMITKETLISEVNFEARTSVKWLSLEFDCQLKLSYFPECKHNIMNIEDLNIGSILTLIKEIKNDGKWKSFIYRYYPNLRNEETMTVVFNEIPITLPESINRFPEFFTPESFLKSYDKRNLPTENLMMGYDFDVIYRNTKLVIFIENTDGSLSLIQIEPTKNIKGEERVYSLSHHKNC